MLLYYDSYDHYGTQWIAKKYTNSSPAYSGSGSLNDTVRIVPGVGRCGTQCIESTPVPGSIGFVRGVTMSGTTFITGFAVNPLSGGFARYHLFTVYRGGLPLLQVSRNIDGSLSALINPDAAFPTTAWVTDGGLIPNDNWTHLGFKTVFDAVSGSVVVQINGITAWTVSGIPTISSFDVGSGMSWWNGVQYGGSNFTNTTRYDDLYIMNADGGRYNDLLGDAHVEYLRPVDVGTFTQWDLTGAPTNWQAVDDDATPDTSSFVHSSTPDVRDSYEYQDLAVLAGVTVFGVQASALAQKDNPGDRAIEAQQVTGGVPFESGIVSPLPLLDWQYVVQTMEDNPATGNPWLLSEVNAAEFGPKLEI
jgi:hypothetical protein